MKSMGAFFLYLIKRKRMKRVFILFLAALSCGQPSEQNEKQKSAEKKEKQGEQAFDRNAVNMLDPLFASNIFANPYYFVNPINPQFIKQNKIRTIRAKVYTNGETVQEGLKIFEFNEDGELIHFYEHGVGESTDTAINVAISWENGQMIKREPVRNVDLPVYVHTYEKNSRTETEFSDDEETAKIIIEKDDRGNLKKITEYGMRESFGYRLFYNGEITENDKREAAKKYASEFHQNGFMGLDLIQLNNGFPVKNIEIREDATVIPQSVTTWVYDEKSRVVDHAAPTMGGDMAHDTYVYDEKGLLKEATQTNGWRLELEYDFFE